MKFIVQDFKYEENLLSAGLALALASLFFLIVLVVYSSPIRAFLAEKCCKSWKEPPALERKLTTLTSSVGEGLKRRFTFKMNEAKFD